MKLSSSIRLFLITTLFLVSCGAAADDGDSADYAQFFSSGTLAATTEGDFILSLQLSPVTVWFEEYPGTESGMVETETFFDDYTAIFPGENPNAVLVLNDKEGQVASVVVSLSNASYTAGMGQYTIAVVQITDGPASVTGDGEFTTLEAIVGELGAGSLFIDSGCWLRFFDKHATCRSGKAPSANMEADPDN